MIILKNQALKPKKARRVAKWLYGSLLIRDQKNRLVGKTYCSHQRTFQQSIKQKNIFDKNTAVFATTFYTRRLYRKSDRAGGILIVSSIHKS